MFCLFFSVERFRGEDGFILLGLLLLGCLDRRFVEFLRRVRIEGRLERFRISI